MTYLILGGAFTVCFIGFILCVYCWRISDDYDSGLPGADEVGEI